MHGLEHTVADTDAVRACKRRLSREHLNLAFCHGASKVLRNVLDHMLLAIDQGRPVEPWLADRNVVDARALDFVQSVSGGHQDLFWRAAAVGAGAAEVSRFNHRDRHSGAADRTGHADAGIAAAKDHHVEFFRRHLLARLGG